MKGNFIYALIDPRTDEIRYVGKCSGYLNSRLKTHLYEARTTSKHTHKLAWIRNLLSDNREPTIEVLEELEIREDLGEAECRWIKDLLEIGINLTNGTAGGEGVFNPSPFTREKLRKRPQVGWPASAREACRERMKKLWQDPEYRAMMVEKIDKRRNKNPFVPLQGEELSQRRVEIAKMMGERNKGKIRSLEQRKKVSEGVKKAYKEGRLSPRKGYKHSEETRRKMREAWVVRKAHQQKGGGAT